MKYAKEVLFCARYLSDRGYTSKDYDSILAHVNELDIDYNLVAKQPVTFFRELAEKLRELWPPGEKDGKYPWRDSVDNLQRRLQDLWTTRFPERTFTIEQCLTVARRYLAQYQDNTKFMQILKYYIRKDKSSRFADMLESAADIAQTEDQYTDKDYVSTEEGVLI